MKLSIIIPVYNEFGTIREVLSRVSGIELAGEKEIIVVDDGSADGTGKILSDYLGRENFKILIKKKNRGKSVAVRSGLELAKGEIIAFHDADLEYQTSDLAKLINYLDAEKDVSVVYGSRFLEKYRAVKNIFYFGNLFLSWITSLLYGQKITDVGTAYKVFKKEALNDVEIKSGRFDMEPELTAKIIKKGYKIKELPIKYSPRNIREGRKIRSYDGLRWLLVLLKHRFL